MRVLSQETMIMVLVGQLFISVVAARKTQMCVLVKRGQVIATIVIVVFNYLLPFLDGDCSSRSFDAVTFLSLFLLGFRGKCLRCRCAIVIVTGVIGR